MVGRVQGVLFDRGINWSTRFKNKSGKQAEVPKSVSESSVAAQIPKFDQPRNDPPSVPPNSLDDLRRESKKAVKALSSEQLS